MFFEVLVLATKDAVKVEQGAKSIGGPLKIGGKQALWGSWAEENASGAMSQLSQAL
jgi:cohesin complex subunit SCC1